MSLTWLFGPSRVPSESPSNTATSTTLASSSTSEDAASQCPVDHSTRSKWLQGRKASGGTGGQEAGASHPFIPGNSVSMSSSSSSSSSSSKAKAAALSAERETSTIPRFLASSSNSQDAAANANATAEASGSSSSKWVYPSPSQFFSALQRKDRNPKQEDMDTVVTIHNAVNERTWQEVMKWEREAGEQVTPQLVTFKGRPNDRSPRAWWKVLIGYQPPFDRHDWIVDRNGKRIRYVIDFYTGRGANAALPAGVPPQLAFYLDVRPALDDYEGVKMRVRHNINRLFGFTAADNNQRTGA